MDCFEFKKILVDECKKQQLKVIDNLKSIMNEAQQSANEYGPPKDRYDSYRMQLLRKKDMYGQQLQKALSELYALEKIDINKEINKVGFGSVIFTNDQNIFISIGLGKILAAKKNFLAVSLTAPLSKALIEKQKGDVVLFNDKKIEIKEIF